MNTPEIDRDALMYADLAFVETEGAPAKKVQAAVWAYLWAQANPRKIFDMDVYPSFEELREALAGRS